MSDDRGRNRRAGYGYGDDERDPWRDAGGREDFGSGGRISPRGAWSAGEPIGPTVAAAMVPRAMNALIRTTPLARLSAVAIIVLFAEAPGSIDEPLSERVPTRALIRMRPFTERLALNDGSSTAVQ